MTSQRDAVAMIEAREPFRASALTGQLGGAPMSGRLPGRYLKDFAHACHADDFYVVMSYATPIAWFAGGTWYVPDVRYSVTTSKHQNRLCGCSPRIADDGYRA